MNRLVARSLLAAFLLAGFTGHAAAGVLPKIIGGSAATDGAYPFMAALVSPHITAGDHLDQDFQAQFCGGTVVAARWVLTAAHCVTETNGTVSNANSIQVITGVTTLSNDPATGAPRINVAKILRHPDFNDTTLQNDVALLYLASSTAVDSNFAPDDGTAIGAATLGDDLTAIGWGVTNQNGTATTADDSFSPTLQEVLLNYIPFATCNGATYYAGQIHSDTLCAGFLAAPPRDTCFGDSGGPLLRAVGGGAWRQVGITSYSFGNFCATASEPGIYVDAAQFYGYIHGATIAPDLRITFSTVGTPTATAAVSRITVTNLSPANASTGTSLLITLDSNTTVTNLASLPGCTGTAAGPLTCDLAVIGANGSTTRDIALGFTGDGVHTITGNVSSAAGDYYASNNTGHREYSLLPPPPTPASGGGGGATGPLALLGLLAFCLVRRRPHAPHHSLRLR